MFASIQHWRARLSGHPTLRPVAQNTGWLLFDKLMRMILALLVNAWVARYLGPRDFGELAYVLATMAFFQVLTTLGADGIVVRDIARHVDDAPRILGTLLSLRLVAGVLSWIIAVGVTAWFNPADPRIVTLVAIAAAGLVFQSADVVDLWFQSQTQSRRTVLAKLTGLLFANAVKIALILLHAPLAAFAAVIALEVIANAAGLALVYPRFRTSSHWRGTRELARQLLAQSWPFMLSGLSVIVYMRIDQLMIKNMLGEAQLGIYAAALSISQLWHVVPTTLVISLAPFIARRKAQGEARYQQALLLLFRGFGVAALCVSAATALAGPILVRMMYGSQYAAAAPILSIHVFSNFFVFQGVAQGLWLTNERAGYLSLLKTLLGGIAAVVVNLLLLPRYGLTGAATGALISFGISAVFSNLLYAPKIFLMQFGIRTAVHA